MSAVSGKHWSVSSVWRSVWRNYYDVVDIMWLSLSCQLSRYWWRVLSVLKGVWGFVLQNVWTDVHFLFMSVFMWPSSRDNLCLAALVRLTVCVCAHSASLGSRQVFHQEEVNCFHFNLDNLQNTMWNLHRIATCREKKSKSLASRDANVFEAYACCKSCQIYLNKDSSWSQWAFFSEMNPHTANAFSTAARAGCVFQWNRKTWENIVT